MLHTWTSAPNNPEKPRGSRADRQKIHGALISDIKRAATGEEFVQRTRQAKPKELRQYKIRQYNTKTHEGWGTGHRGHRSNAAWGKESSEWKSKGT